MDMLMHGGYLPFFISSIPILVFFFFLGSNFLAVQEVGKTKIKVLEDFADLVPCEDCPDMQRAASSLSPHRRGEGGEKN